MQPQATQTPPKTEPQATKPAGPSSPSSTPAKAYGKRPVWQWLVIYLVVAIILYGIIYFVWIHKSGSTSTGY